MAFLNAGGTPSALQAQLEKAGEGKVVQNIDVTGDDIPEVIVNLDQGYVLGCVNKTYVPLLIRQAEDPQYPPTLTAMDLTGDHVAEIVVSEQTWGMNHYMLGVEILQWNGAAFRPLPLCYRNPSCQAQDLDTEIDAPDGELEFKDLSHNGKIAVILHAVLADETTNPPTVSSDILALEWDGSKFVGRQIQGK